MGRFHKNKCFSRHAHARFPTSMKHKSRVAAPTPDEATKAPWLYPQPAGTCRQGSGSKVLRTEQPLTLLSVLVVPTAPWLQASLQRCLEKAADFSPASAWLAKPRSKQIMPHGCTSLMWSSPMYLGLCHSYSSGELRHLQSYSSY